MKPLPQMASSTPTAKAERGPTSGIHTAVKEIPKPLLASEVLRDELAPLQPARSACRVWFLGIAIALGLLGAAMRWGVGVPAVHADAATIAFSAAGAVAALAALPFPYALRGAVAVLLGAVLMVLGARGAGPLAGMAVDGSLLRVGARLVALTVLPAALMFRSRYRAFPRARHVLAAAMGLAAPFIALEVMLAFEAGAPTAVRVAASLSIAAVLSGLFGFMGEATTGASGFWAALVLAALPAEIAVRQLTPLADADSGYLTYPATAIGILCASLLTSVGVYQLLAAFWAPEARRLSLTGRAPADSQKSRKVA